MPVINIPPAASYSNPLVAVPQLDPNGVPPEGRMLVNCEIDWGTTDNNLGAVSFNMQNNATLNFSQIEALVVDNSDCGADIEFVFTDTNVTVTVPAYLPYAVIPLFTRSKQWVVVAVDPDLSTDVTRFSILNYQPMPAIVPTTTHQNVSAAPVLSANTNSQQIIASTISGTLESLQVFYSTYQVTTNFTQNWTIEDGTNKVIAAGQMSQIVGGSLPYNNILYNTSNSSVRFTGGLKLILNATGTAIGNYSVNVNYRNP